MMNNLNERILALIYSTLGGFYLKGAKYIITIIEQHPDGIYKNKDMANYLKISEQNMERAIRYYISYIKKINTGKFWNEELQMNKLSKLTVKNFVKHLIYLASQFDDFKIIQFNEEDFIATSKSLEETVEWYCEEYGYDKEDYYFEGELYYTEIDIDKEGMWFYPLNEEDKKRIGKNHSVMKDMNKITFGDLQWYDCEIYKFMSYREAVRRYISYNDKGYSEDMFVIASKNF